MVPLKELELRASWLQELVACNTMNHAARYSSIHHFLRTFPNSLLASSLSSPYPFSPRWSQGALILLRRYPLSITKGLVSLNSK
jgi:hypothetical protein